MVDLCKDHTDEARSFAFVFLQCPWDRWQAAAWPGGRHLPAPIGRRSPAPGGLRRARPLGPSLCAPRRAAAGDAVRAARQRGCLGAVRAGGGRGQHGREVPRLRPGGRRQRLQLQEGECGRLAGRAPGPEPGRAARAAGGSTCLRSRAGPNVFAVP